MYFKILSTCLMSFFVFVLNAIKGALTSSVQKPIKDKAYLVGVGFGS